MPTSDVLYVIRFRETWLCVYAIMKEEGWGLMKMGGMWDEVCLTANAQLTFLDEESRGIVKRGTVSPTLESIWNRIDQKYLSSPSEEHDSDNSYKQDHHAIIKRKCYYYFQYHRIKHCWSFIKNGETFWRQLHLGKVIHFTSRRKQTAQYMSEFDRGSVGETTEIAITNRTVAAFQKCWITIYSSSPI